MVKNNETKTPIPRLCQHDQDQYLQTELPTSPRPILPLSRSRSCFAHIINDLKLQFCDENEK